MSEGVAPGRPPEGSPTRWPRRFPFWVLQATEIVVALIFVDISIHVAHGDLLLVAALAMVALAITAHGPLGIVRVCGQRLHVLLASVLAVLLALAPIVPALRPDIQGIIVIEFGAVGLFRVATLTRTDGVRSVHAGSPGRVRVIDTTASVVGTTAPPGPATSPGPATAPGPATSSGPSATTGPRATSGPTTNPESAARRAGRASSTVVTTGKRVAAKYRPEAEEQVKATIRGVGKWAGKVSARLTPPEDAE
jgi:hypothetical protein